MARSTKDDWLAVEAGDLEEIEVPDVPVKGQSVKIRALSATAGNAANSTAISTQEVRGETRMKLDQVKLDIIRFAEGVIDPKFSHEEATIISGKFGPAFNRVMKEINRISGTDDNTIAETEARFPSVGSDPTEGNGTSATTNADGPDQSRGVSAGTGNVRK